MERAKLQGLPDGLDRVADAIAWIGKLSSWLLIAILAAVLVSIAGGMLRVTSFATWEGEVFLFGSGLSLNSMLELQWHLFGMLLTLTGAYALHRNRHVRVDVLSSHFPPRMALTVEILGDLLLLLPFCLLMIDRSLPLLELAWRTAERSNEDGLTDRWLIKSFVPIGFALLTALGAARVIRNLLTLAGAAEAREPAEVRHDS